MTQDAIPAHYTSGVLLERLRAALASDGVDPDRPTPDDLAPYDHFHGRGVEATRGLFRNLTVTPGEHVLDVGSGIGGPARLAAATFGCRVTGIDLTEEFCDVARHMNTLLGTQENVVFAHQSALAMSFEDNTFDGAYSMNVSMNIADRATLYSQLYRVLKPGGWLALSEIARGPGGEVHYPSPWASSADESFLLSPTDTVSALQAAGFENIKLQDLTAEAAAYRARDAAQVGSGRKPDHRAIELIHGDLTPIIMANSEASGRNNATVSIVVQCSRPV